MRRFGMFFWLFAYGLILFIASCAPIIKTNGEILPDQKTESLRVGVLKKDDVKILMGSPSTVATFDPNIWYYIGQKVEQKTFSGPEVIEQKIIIVSFDENDVLDAYVVRGTDAYREISYESRATPTSGHKLSALEQLLGNYGRFSSLPDEKKIRGFFMAMDISTLKQMIESGIPQSTVRIEDLAGDGDHYAAYVTSAAFAGKSRVQQHRMVYDALQGKMGGDLHALALQTCVPES